MDSMRILAVLNLFQPAIINSRSTICAQLGKNKDDKRAHVHLERDQQQPVQVYFNNDPSAGSPTETLLRLLLPLNDQV
jgi:hypothetical protein